MRMRVRINLLQWGLVVLPLLSAAQPTQLITSARPNADRSADSAGRSASEHQFIDGKATETSADATENQEALNILPLFGERAKTAAQIDYEVHFLSDCDQNFSSRQEASKFFADRGWDYISDGQLDTAAYRFNLAWLLNHNNADAYWGLGVVCYQKEKLPDAIRMLKRGLTVADSNVVLMTDLATVQIKYFQAKQQKDDLVEAEQHLLKAVAISPRSADAYQKLSLVNYMKGDYNKAWDYLHQARSLDLSTIDLSFLNDLLTRHPDPKGVFK